MPIVIMLSIVFKFIMFIVILLSVVLLNVAAPPYFNFLKERRGTNALAYFVLESVTKKKDFELS
jgi:hypothetical protein